MPDTATQEQRAETFLCVEYITVLWGFMGFYDQPLASGKTAILANPMIQHHLVTFYPPTS